MDFQKPSAYKNINTHTYIIMNSNSNANSKVQTLFKKNYQELLEKISSHSTQESSCTCS